MSLNCVDENKANLLYEEGKNMLKHMCKDVMKYY